MQTLPLWLVVACTGLSPQLHAQSWTPVSYQLPDSAFGTTGATSNAATPCPTGGMLPVGPISLRNGCSVTYVHTANSGDQIMLRAIGRGPAANVGMPGTSSATLIISRAETPDVPLVTASRLSGSPLTLLPVSGVYTFASAGNYLITVTATGGTDGYSVIDWMKSGQGCATNLVHFTESGMTEPSAEVEIGAEGGQFGTFSAGVAPGCNGTWTYGGTGWLSTTASFLTPGYTQYAAMATVNHERSERIGTVNAGSANVRIRQRASPCSYSLTASSTGVGEGRTAQTMTVTTSAGCVWDARSDASWLQVYPLEGKGLAEIRYTVFPNFSTRGRSATIMVAGQRFTVVQAAGSGTSLQRFVRLLYFNSFGRLPTDAEVAFQVASGQSREQLALNFFLSPEFASGGRFVAGLYVGLLDRDAEYGGWLFQRDALFSGQVTPTSAVGNFVNSAEFASRHGVLDNRGFVILLYRQILGRAATEAEIDFHAGTLTGGMSRATVASNFLLAAEFLSRIEGRLTAFLAYAVLLQRSPGGPEAMDAQLAISLASRVPDETSRKAALRDGLFRPLIESYEFANIVD